VQFFLAVFLLPVSCPASGAREVRVAVAANFLAPARAIAALCEKEKQIKATLIPSSTGKLYAQIKNGAPFDLFLAADSKRPQFLFKDNLAKVPFTYAIGRVILWTGRNELSNKGDWREALTDPSVQKVALPQPETAPYGAKAQEVLMRANLWRGMQNRLVYGQNVAHAFQYGASGSVDLAFISFSFAFSEAGEKGHYWPVAEAEPVVQQGCILRDRNVAAANDFVSCLISNRAAKIIKKFGYERGQP